MSPEPLQLGPKAFLRRQANTRTAELPQVVKRIFLPQIAVDEHAVVVAQADQDFLELVK